MKLFTFAIDFGNRSIEKDATAETEKDARKIVWAQLSDEAQNAVESIECVDECEIR